jgi:homoserine/homoserine lactone efflux protein
MTLPTWIALFVASWIICLSPGAGVISAMSTGMRFGYRRGLWNILGLQLGAMLLLAIVGVGLGAILATSVLAFDIVKWCGVAYLLYLGIAAWRAKVETIDVGVVHELAPGQLVLQGFLVNATNPKGVVFMLAVLPQFIDPHAPQFVQYVICAATLCAVDIVVMSGYTLLAARLLSRLRDARQVRWMNRVFGSLFIGAALLLASFRRAAT